MSVTDQCRDPKELNILAQIQLNLALEEIKKQGTNPLIVETYRTQTRQNMLYAQGRTTPGNKVTSTLNSIHTKRLAVDVIPQRKVNGKMTAIWNAKDKETQVIITTMTKYGFEAGANWKSFPDSPHFQIAGVSGKLYSSKNTNHYVTVMIQKALNKKLKLTGPNALVTDGCWGKKTTQAVNDYRKLLGYKETSSIGQYALKKLLS